MSFILDALKKSEIERQRQSAPGLIDVPGRPRRRRLPGWALALGALLAVNLAVLTLMLARKGTPAPAAPRPASAAQPAAAADSALTHHFSPLDSRPADSAPVFAPEIPVTSEDAGGTRMPPAARPARKPDPVLTRPEDPAETLEFVPSINEVHLSGAQALPELHLDVHVFATQPTERFVYINMRKYHEGSVLAEGPTVERIRRDGVVLAYQGLRFLLPRQP